MFISTLQDVDSGFEYVKTKMDTYIVMFYFLFSHNMDKHSR